MRWSWLHDGYIEPSSLQPAQPITQPHGEIPNLNTHMDSPRDGTRAKQKSLIPADGRVNVVGIDLVYQTENHIHETRI